MDRIQGTHGGRTGLALAFPRGLAVLGLSGKPFGRRGAPNRTRSVGAWGLLGRRLCAQLDDSAARRTWPHLASHGNPDPIRPGRSNRAGWEAPRVADGGSHEWGVVIRTYWCVVRGALRPQALQMPMLVSVNAWRAHGPARARNRRHSTGTVSGGDELRARRVASRWRSPNARKTQPCVVPIGETTGMGVWAVHGFTARFTYGAGGCHTGADVCARRVSSTVRPPSRRLESPWGTGRDCDTCPGRHERMMRTYIHRLFQPAACRRNVRVPATDAAPVQIVSSATRRAGGGQRGTRKGFPVARAHVTRATAPTLAA